MAVFHLQASFGSRVGGQSAAAKADYIEREGRYDGDAAELEHSESGNMPEWAEDDPHAYWEAADAHERANGRLYSELQFALPVELDEGQRRDLASTFAQQMTGGERLPYTLAMHRGGGENPHCHMMFSERGNDGIERSVEQWFRRYNAKAPEKGGARKSRAAKAGDWLDKTRETWEREANRALERAGRGERIDHRSLAERREEANRAGDLERAAELSREPNVHLGPERYRTLRGEASETVQRARAVERRNAAALSEREGDRRQVEQLELEIAEGEARLKETYDRVRTAIDKRLQQARRAIRRGSEAGVRAGRAFGRAGATVGRAVLELGRTCATVDRAIRAGTGSAHQVDEYSRRVHRARREIDRQLQGSHGRFNRAMGLIHAEAKQKRNAGDRWDRVAGLIESRIQNRSRGGPGW